MSEQEILKLIENVDPKDTDALDEIDVRVWCWLHNKEFIRRQVTNQVDYTTREWLCYPCKLGYQGYQEIREQQQYTRSRDALKSIKPERWEWVVQYSCEVYHAEIHNGFHSGLSFKAVAKTEELAELHVIIQTLEYERKNNVKTEDS